MKRTLAFAATLMLSACSDGGTSPSRESRVSFQTLAPASGATIQTTGTPPGAFIDRGSGKLSMPVTVEAGNDEPIARLFVYAKDENGITCAQNNSEAPDFSPLKHGTAAELIAEQTVFMRYSLR